MCHAEQLEIPREQNCRFYEILAPYFRKVHTDAVSEGNPVSVALHAFPSYRFSIPQIFQQSGAVSSSTQPRTGCRGLMLAPAHASTASASETMTLALQKWDAAEGLLYVSRKLLSQPYISPIYAMLLYQWLLANKDAGGAEQRQKHINLLTAGLLPGLLSALAAASPFLGS